MMPPDALSSSEVTALADALAADMRRRWGRGDRPVTEDYLAAHPVLRDHPGAAGELIYEEVSLRRESGESVETDEVLRRFPEWATPLRLLLELRDALAADADPDYPGPGDRLGEFLLLAELGRGRRGRVYLARQPALADRPVVVKLTPRTHAEHVSLARLQHTHIVPLYAAHGDPVRRLRVLCMPSFGGATLAHALAALAPVPPAERSAAGLAAALGAEGDPNRPQAWADADYPRVVAWIGACLADALQFAHDRQLVHMDVKPSNVLLTADGQPMLLDFHLARPPLPAGSPPPDWLGGTPAYSAPEHRAALDAVRSGRPIPAPIDGRVDVYALGAVLYEALGGERPGDDPARLSARNRRVSPGLAALVGRCLAADLDERYPDAASVADDLRRHLADLPLRGVQNHTPAERWRKWRRRRPHALGAVGVTLLVLAAVGFVSGYVGHRREAARAALDEGDAALAGGRFAEAAGAYRRGLAVAEGLPVGGGLTDELAGGLRRAELAAGADNLHTVAEGMRALSVVDSVPAYDLARADRLGRQLWANWAALSAVATADLPAVFRERVRTDLLDVVLVWSHLRVRIDPAGRPAALAVLTEADAELGPCAGLYLERATLLRDFGREGEAADDLWRAAATPPASAWEHVALGSHHARRGDHAAARGGGLSELYGGDVAGTPITQSFEVTIPGGSPTGQVFNATSDFSVTDGTNTKPAPFIFASERGAITGWNPGVGAVAGVPGPSKVAEVGFQATDGAVYKDLALAQVGGANFLYATDFHNGKVDVLNAQYHKVTLGQNGFGTFADSNLPAGYAPFGIATINGKLYVSRAKQDADRHDDVAGAGHGFIDVFDASGHLQQRLASRGDLNSPWGMVQAPAGFGDFGNALLVGNFGDGLVHAFDINTGRELGTLSEAPGRPLVIDGLWGLAFGNGRTAGDANTLYYAGGPGHESHGLTGKITANPAGANPVTARMVGDDLVITGSRDDDRVSVTLDHFGDHLVATAGGQRIGTFDVATVGTVRFNGLAGDDEFTVDKRVTNTVLADGGAGDDVLSGGGGDFVLLGEIGDDVLTGDRGRGILVGGDGQDQLHAGGQDTILIGGTTSADADPSAVLPVLAAWDSSASYNARVAGLRTNAAGVLKVGGIAVSDDGVRDDFFGDPGLDWFIGELPDVFHGRKANEKIN